MKHNVTSHTYPGRKLLGSMRFKAIMPKKFELNPLEYGLLQLGRSQRNQIVSGF